MKYIKVCYKKYNMICNLMLLIISIGITLGLIISFFLENNLSISIYNYFYESINNYSILSNILYPIIVYLSLFIISLTVIGVFIPFLALLIENISIGLLLGILLKNIGLKGLLFGVIYFIFTKLVYIIFLLYII